MFQFPPYETFPLKLRQEVLVGTLVDCSKKRLLIKAKLPEVFLVLHINENNEM